MSEANITAIENALHTFVRTASGLAATSVFWSHQRNDRPPDPPFITMSLDSPMSVGLYDEERITDNPVPTAGAEILIDTHAQTEAVLRLQCFTRDIHGPNGAKMLLGRVYKSLSRELLLEPLNVVGVAIADRGSVVSIPALWESDWEGRAALDVVVRYIDGITDPTTFIETVVTTGDYDE